MARNKKVGFVRAVVGASALGVLVLFFVVFAVGMYVGPRMARKGDAPRAAEVPIARMFECQPIAQHESHTCGFLALSSVYASYGLSPDEANIRYRLGVDTVAHPFDEKSTGTVHPDLFRVLVQDGFSYTLIDPGGVGAAGEIREHIGAGGAAMVLVRRRETGGLHWVVADGIAGGAVRIVDSLAGAPVEEELGTYLEECVVSVVGIGVRGPRGETGIDRAHLDGIAELNRVRVRLGEKD